MGPASSQASTRRRRRRLCLLGRRCAASGVTPPGATKAAGRCTASNSMRHAAAPAPAASTATATSAPGPALRRSTTSRASGACSAAPALRSEAGYARTHFCSSFDAPKGARSVPAGPVQDRIKLSGSDKTTAAHWLSLTPFFNRPEGTYDVDETLLYRYSFRLRNHDVRLESLTRSAAGHSGCGLPWP